MPNDCWNHITITCEYPDQLTSLIQNELQEKQEDGKWIYHETIEMIRRGAKGIMFRLWTPWSPNFEWLESLLTNYSECWVKNEWNEEGGMAGVWVGFIDQDNEQSIKQMTWTDLCIEARHYLFLDEQEQQEEVVS
jgi:hypothetical protein